MKQIKNKLNKLDKEIKILQDLEKTNIKITNNNNEKIEEKINNIDSNRFGYYIGFIILILILLGVSLGNVALTKELHDQYYIEEKCSCNK